MDPSRSVGGDGLMAQTRVTRPRRVCRNQIPVQPRFCSIRRALTLIADMYCLPPLAQRPGGLTTSKIQSSDWHFSIGKEAAGHPPRHGEDGIDATGAPPSTRNLHEQLTRAKTHLPRVPAALSCRGSLGRVEPHATLIGDWA
jgi:hypothetical protein